MFNQMKTLSYKIVILVIALALVGLVGCGKKMVKSTPTGLEKAGAKEAPAESKLEEEKLEVAEIEKEVPSETRIDIKEIKEAPELKDVYFEFDKSDITPQAIASLNKNAEWLKANPKVKILVEGHCDERGTIEYNLALGQKRATSVRNYLISLGIKAERINSISYGEEKPLDPAHNEEAWARNRRAHTVLVKY